MISLHQLWTRKPNYIARPEPPRPAPAASETAPTLATVNTAMVQASFGQFRARNPTTADPAALRRHLNTLTKACFADATNRQIANGCLDSLFAGEPFDLAPLSLQQRDILFAHNLLSLRPRLAPTSAPPSASVTRTARGEDCLASGHDEWSLFRVLNLAVMASLPARRRAAIVTSIRDEGMSILEWLAHHRALGFDDFYIYTNDNTDESDALLCTLASHGIIHLIGNDVAPGVKVQSKILEHSLHLLPELRDFEWVFYIDADEFFMSRCEPGLTLDSFMAQFDATFGDERPSAVAFNWKWFGSENAFAMTDGLLLERFVHSIHNEHVKSLVRLADTVSMRRVHVPVLADGAWMVDSNFTRVEPSINMQPTYGTGQLNHYWNKSFQEFALKRARGRISAGLGAPPIDFVSFFEWGANGRRGNYDPPPGRVLARVAAQYETLLRLPDVEANLAAIRRRSAALIRAIDAEYDLKELHRTHGAPQAALVAAT